jgi:hypothetical protein
MAVLAVAAKWLQHHPWLLVDIGRGVRGYLDGWAIDIDNGFGLIERAKIALAFGLPLLALGLVLSVLWVAAAAVVTMVGRWWGGWRVRWRRPC